MALHINVLGDFSLEHQRHTDGAPAAAAQRTISVAAQKSKALLAWLVCHPGQSQPRDRVAGVLWPDREPANAKASLRQALTGLRKQLPDNCLQIEGEYLAFNPQTVSSDLDRFRRWRQASHIEALRYALDAYRGELLDGFNSRSEIFAEWLSLEREAVRREALAGLRELMNQEQDAGELAAAVTTGGRLLALDPLQEAVHRKLMRLYAELGQLGSAQRQFRLCRDALARELKVPPAAETVALFNALGRTESPAEDDTGPPPAVPVSAAPADHDRRAALPNIVVLPFRTLSSVADHEYLADGMTEELINLLSNSANWRVAARNLAFQYKHKQPDVRSLGTELGAAYVVEGSIRAVGERVRISTALISVSDGTPIWSNRYDRLLADLFEVQDEVVHSIFRTLKNRLGFAERERVRRTPTINLNAWGLLIKAMQVNVVDTSSHQAQLELVSEALTIEPNYPRAHAYQASLLFTAVARGISPEPKDYVKRAARHAETALNGGATDTVVLKMCAGGFAAIGRSQQAMALAERAYELSGAPDPLLVAVLMWNGRLQEAEKYCEEIVAAVPRGVTLPPGELRAVALLGNLLMLKGDYQGALELTLRDQRMNPSNYFAHVNVANLYGLMGDYPAAQENWQLAVGIAPSLTVDLFQRGYKHVFADESLAARFSDGLVAAGLSQESPD